MTSIKSSTPRRRGLLLTLVGCATLANAVLCVSVRWRLAPTPSMPVAYQPVSLPVLEAKTPSVADAPPPPPKANPTPKPEAPRATPSAVSAPAIVPAPLPLPRIPRHYEHIRIAMLAYAGNPMGVVEDKLLRESVDLVIPNVTDLKHIHEVAPATPQMIYTNTSNLYQELLTDWLAFADAKGLSREDAFYHAAAPRPFRGDSPSSLPVTWFWGVYRGRSSLTNLTSAAHAKKGTFAFGGSGESLYLGHPDRFREINVNLASAARNGWSAVLEYPSAVDANGLPNSWAPLKPLADTTNKLSQTGLVSFDPPPDWKSASVGGSERLFFVRFRTVSGGAPPEAATILGRDYVEAKGTTSGIVPAFDARADTNSDGYLDDAEYARHAEGKNARFLHESRMLTEVYGQMRFLSNPSSRGLRDWSVDYHQRLLAKYPSAGGFFMDNSGGKMPIKPGEVVEPLANYSDDCGTLLQVLSKAIQPRWVLPNTVGGGAAADAVVRQNPAYFEEFAVRPMAHTWATFEDVAAVIARRQRLTAPSPIGVIDSHPQKGQLTDPRMQLGVLAYYYMLADPESTFLMFFGGFEPGSTWQRHWTPAAAYNVGEPKAPFEVWATGSDPATPSLEYKVFGREYEHALVLFKPLSYSRGVKEPATLHDDTATMHELNGTYRLLNADGTIGEPITSVSLRNGEGAILLRSR